MKDKDKREERVKVSGVNNLGDIKASKLKRKMCLFKKWSYYSDIRQYWGCFEIKVVSCEHLKMEKKPCRKMWRPELNGNLRIDIPAFRYLNKGM